MEDRAALLTKSERQRVEALHRRLLQDMDIHILTYIAATSPADLDAEAGALFDRYALGRGTHGARGVLFLVDPGGEAVRVEVGYDLEGVFPDVFVGYIEREQMAPFFAGGRIGAGIEATVELLVSRALEAAAAGTDAPPGRPVSAGRHYSGGAGARSRMPVGSGTPPKPSSAAAERFGPQPTPLGALAAYRQVLAHRIKDPDLELYTPSTRKLFRRWLVTDAQQNNEGRLLALVMDKADVRRSAELAVIRFPIVNRRAAPYFLRLAERGWMLDFAAMHRLVRFNHRNQWHFRSTDHQYMFAFSDVRFDRHGFPHAARAQP